MYLKFIGNNGSMGLCHGEIYEVRLKTKDDFIWVIIPNFELRDKVRGTWKCPYSSPATFAANWASVKEAKSDG